MIVSWPLKEVKPMWGEHIWKGEEAEVKWLDLKLDDAVKDKAVKCGANEVTDMSAVITPDNKMYFKCGHCNAVWDQQGYPKLEFQPFEHIKCPACHKVVAQTYKDGEAT
jgi:phage FluMu protein Com